jgi:hypothetical protein
MSSRCCRRICSTRFWGIISVNRYVLGMFEKSIVRSGRSRSRMRKMCTFTPSASKSRVTPSGSKHLHCSGMNHAGTRRVGTGRLPIDDQRLHAEAAQLGRQCKAGRPRTCYEDLVFDVDVLHVGFITCSRTLVPGHLFQDTCSSLLHAFHRRIRIRQGRNSRDFPNMQLQIVRGSRPLARGAGYRTTPQQQGARSSQQYAPVCAVTEPRFNPR